MNISSVSVCSLLVAVCLLGNISCDGPHNCLAHNDNESANTQQLYRRLSQLTGQRFQVIDHDSVYSVAVCGVLASNLTNASVLQTPKTDPKVPVVLGRVNDTHVVGGDSWLLLTYGGGDDYKPPSSCVGPRKAEILMICNKNAHTPLLSFMENNEIWKKGGCFFMFELQTSEICPPPPPEKLSNGSVFCIIFLTSVGVYLIVGVCYRRLVKGAKGFEQIPHHEFWKKLGNLQADGCNLVCRREDRREESWRRLTNNFGDPQDDRDDALLRP